jgi:hypothetical protein
MKRTSTVAMCLALAATACMKNGDGDDGTLTEAQTRAAGDALGNGVEDSAKSYGPMVSSGADLACTTLSGDTSDPDGDAIPTGATLTYNCTSRALGYTGMLTGTIAVTDDEPAMLAWAFTGDADLHASLTGPGGATLTSDWNGSIIGSQATGAGPFALDRSLDVVTTFVTGGGDLGGEPTMTSVVEDNAWTITFTPTLSWQAGQLVVNGNLAATGSWNVTVDQNPTLTATLATPTPLVVMPSCETLLTSGVVTATYPIEMGGTETLTVTWTGCGQRTVSRQ